MRKSSLRLCNDLTGWGVLLLISQNSMTVFLVFVKLAPNGGDATGVDESETLWLRSE